MPNTQNESSHTEVILPKRSSELVFLIKNENPMHGKALDHALSRLKQDSIEKLEAYLTFCEEKRLDIKYIASSYLTIVSDTFNEQMYFMKHKKYRHSSFEDVAANVYFNDEYMSKYMYGLAVTTFFWPNHQDIEEFFAETLPLDRGGKYLEVGPGHGFFFMSAVKNTSFDIIEGIDLSETSVKLTTEIIDFFDVQTDKKVAIKLQDFLKEEIEPNSIDAFVMGEVLEHVEQPQLFMDRVHEITKSDAHIFITTCCNAPAVDHIYLFDKASEVEELFHRANLKIVESLILPTVGKDIETCEKQKLPVNVAYVLTNP